MFNKLILIFFISFSFLNPTIYGFIDDSIKIKILEERINQLEIDGDKDVEDGVKSIQDMNKVRIDTINEKVDTYLFVILGLLALIGFFANYFGKSAVKKRVEEIVQETAGKYAKERTDEEINIRLREEVII